MRDGLSQRPEHFRKTAGSLNAKVVRAYTQPKIDFIRGYAGLSGRILNIGCGGVLAIPLAESGASVIRIDSSKMLTKNPHSPSVRGAATSLPFGDETFDLVFEENMLYCAPDREQSVREMCRVSRRYVVLVEPNRYNPAVFAYSLVARGRRGGLNSCVKRLREELRYSGLHILGHLTTGMISPNSTPNWCVSLLSRFDRPIRWGRYIVVVAEKYLAPKSPRPGFLPR